MKRALVLMMIMVCYALNGQIEVISTGTSERLVSIRLEKGKIFVSGWNHYLSKCYGDCGTLVPLSVPIFPNSNYYFQVSHVDTSSLYMAASCFQTLNFTIWKSVNGGESWIKRFDTTSTSMFRGSICFFDSTNGLAVTSNFVTINTSDGFSTYSFGSWPSTSAPSAAISRSDSVAAVLDVDGVYLTDNRGKTWPKYFGTGVCTPVDLIFVGKDTVVFITQTAQWSTNFVTSFDGGDNWNDVYFTVGGPLPPDNDFVSLCSHKGSYPSGQPRVDLLSFLFRLRISSSYSEAA